MEKSRALDAFVDSAGRSDRDAVERVVRRAYRLDDTVASRMTETLLWMIQAAGARTEHHRFRLGLPELGVLFVVFFLVVFLAGAVNADLMLSVFGFVVCVIVVYIVLSLVESRSIKRSRRTRNRCCRQCAYRLGGLESAGSVEVRGGVYELGPRVCPECGGGWPLVLP